MDLALLLPSRSLAPHHHVSPHAAPLLAVLRSRSSDCSKPEPVPASTTRSQCGESGACGWVPPGCARCGAGTAGAPGLCVNWGCQWDPLNGHTPCDGCVSAGARGSSGLAMSPEWPCSRERGLRWVPACWCWGHQGCLNLPRDLQAAWRQPQPNPAPVPAGQSMDRER